MYEVYLSRSAVKELERLPDNILSRVVRKLESLSLNPRPKGTVKIKGRYGLYRVRIGDYRIVYSVDDRKRIVDVSLIRHRKDIYK